MLMASRWIGVIAIILPGLPTHPALGIVLSDPNGDHSVAPGDSVNGVNLDGVALLGTDSPNSTSIEGVLGPHCTGVLIADQHMLSAAHCFDYDRDGRIHPRFPFVAAFELSDRDVLIQVDKDGIQMPEPWPYQETDIAVLTLAKPAPQEIPRYLLYGRRDEVGKPVLLVGYGLTGFGETGVDDVESADPVKRTGLNRYDAIRGDMPGVGFLAYDFDSGLAANNTLAVSGFDSVLGFGANEALAAPGESGGPLFIDGVIAGLTSFSGRLPEADIDGIENQSWGEVGFDVRVSQFRDFILSSTDNQAIFVPEPSSFCLFAAASVVIVLLAPRRPRPIGKRPGTNDREDTDLGERTRVE